MPQEVSEELRRVVQRWQQLPLDHALARMPAVRAQLGSLAAQPVPDLGPGVVMDQLTVLVYDRCSVDRSEGLAASLAGLRAALA